MPKTTKASVLERMTTRYDAATGSRRLYLDEVAVGRMVSHGSSDPRTKRGNVSSKTVYVLSGSVDGVTFREEGATAKATLGKVAAVVAKGLNAKSYAPSEPGEDDVSTGPAP